MQSADGLRHGRRYAHGGEVPLCQACRLGHHGEEFALVLQGKFKHGGEILFCGQRADRYAVFLYEIGLCFLGAHGKIGVAVIFLCAALHEKDLFLHQGVRISERLGILSSDLGQGDLARPCRMLCVVLCDAEFVCRAAGLKAVARVALSCAAEAACHGADALRLFDCKREEL